METLIDTHCHIYKEFYDDIDIIVSNFKKDNVGIVFNCADSIKSSLEVIETSKKYKDCMYPVIGIHPEEVLNFTKNDIDNEVEKLEKLINENKIIAIGEIGLDYYYDKTKKEIQKYLFEKQLSLAVKYNLPVIVHVREATLDTINILKKYNVKGIIHCFNGSLETANIYIKMGFLLGIGGLLTFKNCKLKEIINEIGLHNIVFETDSPFLTPEPYRGCKNEPKYVILTLEKLSELTNIKKEELVKITYNNVHSIFDI
jgi:TatD DNase family protein